MQVHLAILSFSELVLLDHAGLPHQQRPGAAAAAHPPRATSRRLAAVLGGPTVTRWPFAMRCCSIIATDASVDQVANLPLGMVAFREDAQSPWKVEPFAGFKD
ncbi:hypothetical protein [Actinoplanes sp. NPDC026623]|uniref:hypothetical protein n=1 Tax=Actinoplanes sp. NPDC026623 TaxID=3155610 RepID=UPI0033C497A1